jgi:S1-C subfamily serine protease
VAEENGQVVVERVAPDGPSDGKLKPGDVIEEVAHQPIANAADLASKIKAAPADAPILLRVKRGEQSRYVAVPRGGH